MWPAALRMLAPFNYTSELPILLQKARQDLGLDINEVATPVRNIGILGACATDEYSNCPTMPAHHIDLAQDDPSFLEHMGRYYWLDFDAIWLETALPLRTVYNTGDADCNDGFWGVAWHQNTGEPIAHINSTGDHQTTVQVLQTKFSDLFESISIPSLQTIKPFFGEVHYPTGENLAKIIGMAISLSDNCWRQSAKLFERDPRRFAAREEAARLLRKGLTVDWESLRKNWRWNEKEVQLFSRTLQA